MAPGIYKHKTNEDYYLFFTGEKKFNQLRGKKSPFFVAET